eukprot:Colp12_sorted_trinity150504_noHs@21989
MSCFHYCEDALYLHAFISLVLVQFLRQQYLLVGIKCEGSNDSAGEGCISLMDLFSDSGDLCCNILPKTTRLTLKESPITLGTELMHYGVHTGSVSIRLS